MYKLQRVRIFVAMDHTLKFVILVVLAPLMSVFTQEEEGDSTFAVGGLQLKPVDTTTILSPEFYKTRYNEVDLMHKVTDNQGDGFDSLYGTRNLRPILHGVAYRGGANNHFHKTNKRKNQNPLPDDGVRNLCSEGFSASVYLYRQNFDTAPPVDSCSCISGGDNAMDYYQFDYNNDVHIYEALKLVYKSATSDTVGPVYLHCWNGWHASGLLAALSLRQFCGFDKWEAINYWDMGTDGANNSPRYQVIREMIKDFEPYPDLVISDSLGNRICPPMPEEVDSSELYVDIEHLVYVPESIPLDFTIVLHNVSFGSGQTSFPKPEKNKDLINLLQALNDQPELKIEVGGYTDNTGSYAKNVELSKKRAKFIYDFLLQHGVEKERISYKGYGPKKPIYSNRYSSTREGNRRIEIKIIDKKQEDYTKLVEEAIDDERFKSSKIPAPRFEDLFVPGGVAYDQEVVIPSISYEPNEVHVPKEAGEDLKKLANWLKYDSSRKGMIAAHTDKSGLEELNELLSKQRAEAVYEYLIEEGVPENQLIFKGFGSSKPLVSNKYQHGREKNRRVSFIWLQEVE